jgi:hypothetical protein
MEFIFEINYLATPYHKRKKFEINDSHLQGVCHSQGAGRQARAHVSNLN